MADIRAIVAGSVLVDANWNGGVAPGPGDNAFANNLAMTIPGDWTVDNMFTTAGGGGVAGGSFTCSTGGVTINGHANAGSSVCLVISNATGTVTWNGNANGSNTANIVGANFTGVGTCVHNGTKNSGTGGASAHGMQKLTGVGGTLTTTGACNSVTGSAAYGLNIVNPTTGTVNQIGDCTGSPNATGGGIQCNSPSTLTLNITGDLIAQVGTGGNFTNGTIVHDGDIVTNGSAHGCTVSGACDYQNTNPANICTGSPTTVSTYGINTSTSANCWFYGECRAANGNSASGYGMQASGTGDYRVGTSVSNDYPNGGATQPCGGTFANGNTVVIKVRRTRAGSGGVTPTVGRHYILDDVADNSVEMRQSNAGAVTVLGDVAADYPAESDVRAGVQFDFGAMEGTCAVPPASAVAAGTPVDATTGTAVITVPVLTEVVVESIAAF
jgi:hypothetical protein